MPKPQYHLPRQFDSAALLKQAIPGETIVVLQYKDAHNQSAFPFSDRNGRVGIMHFDAKLNCHALRVPEHLWNADRGAMAHAFMQTGGSNRLVVTTETPIFKSQCGQAVKSPGSCSGIAGSTPATATTPPETGATEQGQDALNVVGRGAPDASTVAPSSGCSGPGTIGPDFLAEDNFREHVKLGEPSSETISSGSEIPPEQTPLWSSKAWELLEKPMRLKALAALLETDEEMLKAALQDPFSTVELGHAGWVKRREPQA